MGQFDHAKPLHEGQVIGTEINSRNGKPYGFHGHFLGNGTIIYQATVSDQHGSYRGELSGVFDHADRRTQPGPASPLLATSSDPGFGGLQSLASAAEPEPFGRHCARPLHFDRVIRPDAGHVRRLEVLATMPSKLKRHRLGVQDIPTMSGSNSAFELRADTCSGLGAPLHSVATPKET